MNLLAWVTLSFCGLVVLAVVTRILFGLAAMRREARLTGEYARTMESD